MKTIEPFIKLGWHTVPLTGELKRQEDGTKTIPNFPKGWREKYATKLNTTATKIGGVITGTKSGILAIDCDNSDTFNLFRMLDPKYSFVFVSKGKGKDCGTILYRYYNSCPTSFGIKNELLELDFYGENGFVYLPTENNTSKETWHDIPEIKEAPPAVKTLLVQLHLLYQNKARPAEAVQETSSTHTSYLAPLIDEFVLRGEFMPGLFKIITPKAFRSEKEYVKRGYLHPKNIPDGRGSEYLSKLSTIFGADPSVDDELYVKAMHAVNCLWDDPMDSARMDKTICDPMIEQKVSINGEVVWQYDKLWAENRLVMRTKRQASIEVAYDDQRLMYYIIDLANERSQQFDSDNALQGHLEAITVNPVPKKELKSKLPIINVRANPSKDFGFSDSIDATVRDFNPFISSPELRIINDPESYKSQYNEPKMILKYLETLIPEDAMRDYTLGFLKRKLTTFKYSPAVLYFLGVHGSGKDTFVSILEKIMGHVARPKAKEFIEKNNAWLLDAYFVQLDEFGNQLNKASDKDEALGLLKAYSGKPKVSVRTMRNDGYDYHHSVTFIMTQNKQPLMLEDGDRRIVFLHTPNVLSTQEWVEEAGGITKVYDLINAEIKDFCYYLATEVEAVTPDAYMVPPYSKHKHNIIADSMFAAQRISYAVKYGMQDYLIDLANEYNDERAAKAFSTARVTTGDLETLYDEMTEYKGEMRSLVKVLRASGVQLMPTTTNGEKVHKLKLNWESKSPFGDNDDYED